MAKFTGVVRIINGRAKLETPKQQQLDLIPFPQKAPFTRTMMQAIGLALFGYQEGWAVEMSGVLAKDTIYNARLETSADPVADVKIAPDSSDLFAQDIALYFQTDSKQIAAKLNDAGIRTVSALYHRIRNNYAEELPAFSKYLKVPRDRIRELLAKLETAPGSQGLVRSSPRFPVKRGINLNDLAKLAPGGKAPAAKRPGAAPPKFPANAETPNLPSTVSLAAYMTPVKDQGMRGTCVAHAAAACLEAEYVKAGLAIPTLNLSEQYLCWACKQIDGAANNEGTFLQFAAKVLIAGVPLPMAAGACTERQWRYNPLPVAGNEAQGPPRPGVRAALDKGDYRPLKCSQLRHTSIRALKTALADGHCVGLSVYTYHFWTDDFAWREGVISLPLGIQPDGAHAICLVGYEDDDAAHRDGYFVFKNSWDIRWGYGGATPGYGRLPYRYVIREAIEAYTIER